MATKGYDLRRSKLRSKYLAEIPGSKWRRLKKTPNPELAIGSRIYFQYGETDASGEVTFEWDSSLVDPCVIPTLYPGGDVNPTPNIVLIITDYNTSTHSVTCSAVEYNTATIGSDVVLINSTTPVEGIMVAAAFLHDVGP